MTRRGEANGDPGLFDGLPVEPRPPARRPPPPPEPPQPAAPAPAPERAQPPLYSVSQLTGAIAGRLAELGRVRVEGEVTQRKRLASGHVFFDLKDAGAKLACKVWQSKVAQVLKVDLAEGAKVIAWGKLDVYAPQGGYSLIVDRLELQGLGTLLVELEERKRQLAARGWFERKRPLPRFPRTIGVVTSRDGAALRDFLETRSKRWPGYPVRLAHTIVQGPGAARCIAAALRALERSGVDAIALVRGGGSLEDLWAFNELPVAEAIWECRVPVVSGVGHQTDVTLADHVADLRAHTPTDAAQALIPDRRELDERIARLGNYLTAAFDRAWSEREERLARLAARPVLRDAAWILDERTRALGALHARLDGALRGALDQRASALARGHARLARRSPEGELARRAQRVAVAESRLTPAVRAALERRERAVASAARALEAVSPVAVLGRGYSITRRADGGAALTDAGALAPGDALETRLARGTVRSRVESVRAEENPA